jgi:UDP-3-O-[3-hydroxymyristoyl] glucosamine N-acyltransferase
VFTLVELADRFDAELIGDEQCTIERVATLINAGPGDISFLSNPRYRKYLRTTSAAAVVISPSDKDDLNTNGLVVNNPYVVYAHIAALLYPAYTGDKGIHPDASVHASAQVHSTASIGAQSYIGPGVSIGANSRIGPGCVVDKDSTIGSDCLLSANVTVCHDCVIGDRNILHPGVVIGADGFGIAKEDGKWIKIPQVGRAILGDDIEVGANTCIDRGAIEDTIIEDGVKLDNLIQIAHNVRLGAHTAIASATAIAGSTKIGRHCTIGGLVGIVGHIEIADNVMITGMSMVSHNIKEPGTYSSGTPLDTNAHWHRNSVRFKQLDEMARRLKQLEARLEDNNNG